MITFLASMIIFGLGVLYGILLIVDRYEKRLIQIKDIYQKAVELQVIELGRLHELIQNKIKDEFDDGDWWKRGRDNLL